jgi:hypothetical protein
MNFSPGLASNHDSPDFQLLSGWDYRHEPPPLAGFMIILRAIM